MEVWSGAAVARPHGCTRARIMRSKEDTFQAACSACAWKGSWRSAPHVAMRDAYGHLDADRSPLIRGMDRGAAWIVAATVISVVVLVLIVLIAR